jgi:hypothetical protein
MGGKAGAEFTKPSAEFTKPNAEFTKPSAINIDSASKEAIISGIAPGHIQ